MSDLFYLDTARYGRMCDRARRAADDLHRLSAVEGCSASFERLLREGFGAWPFDLRHEYRGLRDWAGVGELKRQLRRLLGGCEGAEVLLAQRSAVLLGVGLAAAFGRCRKLLTTDLDWPAYRTAAAAAAARSGAEVECVRLHDRVFGDRASGAAVAAAIRNHYLSARCDGLFLTAVTNTGVRIPARDVVDLITSSAGRPAFVLVDGTQALGHVPEQLADVPFDFYLAGCHKWLRAQHPLAVAVACGNLGAWRIRWADATTLDAGEVDPILAFTRQLEARVGTLPQYGETVNVTPLFTARAAIADPAANALATIPLNRTRIETAVAGSGWEPVATHRDLSSGILLYRPVRIATRRRTPVATRMKFHEHGVAVTCYDGGVVRLSTPKGFVPDHQYHNLRHAFAQCG